jgi:polysaccharide biosynthesis protein PslH
VSGRKPHLAFVSPVFLFPNDTGGRIRSTNILRGLHNGAFEVTLICPASAGQQRTWAEPLKQLCDHFVSWQPAPSQPRWLRARGLFGALPVNVISDRTKPALDVVRNTLDRTRFDVVVFDFVHAAVLRPEHVDAATVCFTHNVEAEIFARHAQTAANALMRRIWGSQRAKMERFERESLRRFTSVVAVSERDAHQFRERYGITSAATIPTGVDLDFFAWHESPPIDAEHPPTLAFTGSMDWDANIDGVRYFLSEVWPVVKAQVSDARFVVVGRSPPAALVEQAAALTGVSFTGFVDDVRPYVQRAHVFVIPLRVGGGTRIKAFEAMAMGCPVVSTAIGIEGLDVSAGEHYVQENSAPEMARSIIELLRDAGRRARLSKQARDCVENRFGHRVAALAFEQICVQALRRHRPNAAP